MAAAAANLQTDEGKEAAATATRRLVLLRDLKAYVIKQLAKKPYSWGWLSATQVDVLGADENDVLLKGRSVPWAQVSAAQMFRFVQHFIVPDAPLSKGGVGAHDGRRRGLLR